MAQEHQKSPQQPTAPPQQKADPSNVPPAQPQAQQPAVQAPSQSQQPSPNTQPSAESTTDPKAQAQTPTETKDEKEKQETPKKKFSLNLDTRSSALILGFTTILMFAQIYIFTNFNQQLQTSQELLAANEVQIQSQEEISQQLSQFQEQIDIINKAFPDEKGLSTFVQTVDRHISQYNEAHLQFDTNAPIKLPDEAAPFLPLTISAITQIDDFNTFLGYLSNSPYLFMPQRLQVTVEQTLQDPVKVTLKGRLYVNQTLQ